MVRFGRSSVDIRKFLAKMCARSQLNEDMCLQLNKMLESALNSPTRRASILPLLPDSSQSLNFQHPNLEFKQVRKPTLEGMDDDDSEESSSSSQTSVTGHKGRRKTEKDFLGILARNKMSSDGESESGSGEEAPDDTISELSGSDVGSELGEEQVTIEFQETAPTSASTTVPTTAPVVPTTK